MLMVNLPQVGSLSARDGSVGRTNSQVLTLKCHTYPEVTEEDGEDKGERPLALRARPRMRRQGGLRGGARAGVRSLAPVRGPFPVHPIPASCRLPPGDGSGAPRNVRQATRARPSDSVSMRTTRQNGRV